MRENYNNFLQKSHKKINSFSKKSLLSPQNIYINNNSPNLLLKYGKIKNHSETKKSLNNNNNSKLFHKNINNSSKVKIIITHRIQNEPNSLFKSTPKYFLSSLESNVLLGKITQKKSHILPTIYNNNKKMLLNTNLKFKNSYKEIKNKLNNNNTSRKDKYYSSSYNFNPQKTTTRNYYNLYKEINLYKTNEELCKNESIYTYIIRPENCGYLIKNCFKHRKNWKEIENLESNHFNLKWQQNTRGINYNDLFPYGNKKKMVNHFEFLSVISNKANLFINMMEYAEKKEQNVFRYLPFTVLFDYNKVNFFNKLLRFEYLFKNIENFIVSNCEIDDRNYKKDKDRLYGNFFPFINRIGNRTVINIIDTHYNKKQESLFEKTNGAEKTKTKNNYWIIKAPDLNRGRCIKIVNNMMLIKRSIREYSTGIRIGYNEKNNNDENFNDLNENSNNNNINYHYNFNFRNNFDSFDDDSDEEKDEYNSFNNINYNSFNNKLLKDNLESNTASKENNYRSHIIVIQKYIEKPLLYYGRKFDIRIWVLLTQNLNVYMFEEGHLKCCSINYKLNSDNTFCHLTNYSFQKYNSNFGKYEFGNEVSFEDFQKNIDYNYDKKVNFKIDVLPKIKDIIKFTFESVKNKINPLDRKYTFEIFGFDFMLDCNFQPFLIEVNSNPGLEESSPLIKMLVPRMLDDALRLTVDREFGTIYNFNGIEKHSFDSIIPYKSPFPVEGYSDSDNMFKYVCDLNESDDYDYDNYRNYVNSSKLFFKHKKYTKISSRIM